MVSLFVANLVHGFDWHSSSILAASSPGDEAADEAGGLLNIPSKPFTARPSIRGQEPGGMKSPQLT
ncbi:hypothetical protein GOP47_0009178 [Adiantum capillus-veneris]|uniref:Uncharacterized protein n=1 Tax=Adiantum capillus-veneris TaxID=13818 RepID=A0A9D4UXB1_ADICA|nr:hypothetical protein GOP47_0009178 [Adiantum capillus-veneris]